MSSNLRCLLTGVRGWVVSESGPLSWEKSQWDRSPLQTKRVYVKKKNGRESYKAHNLTQTSLSPHGPQYVTLGLQYILNWGWWRGGITPVSSSCTGKAVSHLGAARPWHWQAGGRQRPQWQWPLTGPLHSPPSQQSAAARGLETSLWQNVWTPIFTLISKTLERPAFGDRFALRSGGPQVTTPLWLPGRRL